MNDHRKMSRYERFLRWLTARLDNHVVALSEKKWRKHEAKNG